MIINIMWKDIIINLVWKRYNHQYYLEKILSSISFVKDMIMIIIGTYITQNSLLHFFGFYSYQWILGVIFQPGHDKDKDKYILRIDQWHWTNRNKWRDTSLREGQAPHPLKKSGKQCDFVYAGSKYFLEESKGTRFDRNMAFEVPPKIAFPCKI